MKAIEAVKKLSSLGYRFELAGDRLRYRYEGQGDPDRGMVLPLLEVVKANKQDVLTYLSKPAPRERVLTCTDCPQFQANSGPNPGQGWGKCLKRGRGRYGCATACEAALAPGPKGASNAHLEN